MNMSFLKKKYVATIEGDGRRYQEDIVPIEEFLPEELEESQPSKSEYRDLDFFPMNDMKKYNGNHYIYGWLESFLQSDNIPLWMYRDDLKVSFKVAK